MERLGGGGGEQETVLVGTAMEKLGTQKVVLVVVGSAMRKLWGPRRLCL